MCMQTWMNVVKDIVNKCVTIHQELISVLVRKDTRWTVTTELVQVGLDYTYIH